jgi:hypothetical protein
LLASKNNLPFESSYHIIFKFQSTNKNIGSILSIVAYTQRKTPQGHRRFAIRLYPTKAAGACATLNLLPRRTRRDAQKRVRLAHYQLNTTRQRCKTPFNQRFLTVKTVQPINQAWSHCTPRHSSLSFPLGLTPLVKQRPPLGVRIDQALNPFTRRASPHLASNRR